MWTAETEYLHIHVYKYFHTYAVSVTERQQFFDEADTELKIYGNFATLLLPGIGRRMSL
jgi:hypothetical protein